jgi:superfamily II helicase
MNNTNTQKDVYSKVIRSGNRTYFFDVKKNRLNELYITITESKKQYPQNGNVMYKKYKLHLYKEDFAKFQDSLSDVLNFIEKTNNNS